MLVQARIKGCGDELLGDGTGWDGGIEPPLLLFLHVAYHRPARFERRCSWW